MVQRKHWKLDMRFGTWNVKSLYRLGSLTAVAMELARYKLDLVGVRKVRWDEWGAVRAEDFIYICCGKVKIIINWEQDFL